LTTLAIAQSIYMMNNSLPIYVRITSFLRVQPFDWDPDGNVLRIGSKRQCRWFLLTTIFDCCFRSWRTIFAVYLYSSGAYKLSDTIVQILLAGTFLGGIAMSFNTHLRLRQLIPAVNQLLRLEMEFDQRELPYYRYVGASYLYNTCSTILCIPIAAIIFPKTILKSIYPTLVPEGHISPLFLFLVLSETLVTACFMFNWVFYIIILLKFTRLETLSLTALLRENQLGWEGTLRRLTSMQLLNTAMRETTRRIELAMIMALTIAGTTSTYTALRLYGYFDTFTYMIYSSSAALTLFLQLIPLNLMSNYSELSLTLLRKLKRSIVSTCSGPRAGTRVERKARIMEHRSLRPITFQMSEFCVFQRPLVLPALNTIMSVIIHTLLTWKGPRSLLK